MERNEAKRIILRCLKMVDKIREFLEDEEFADLIIDNTNLKTSSLAERMLKETDGILDGFDKLIEEAGG